MEATPFSSLLLYYILYTSDQLTNIVLFTIHPKSTKEALETAPPPKRNALALDFFFFFKCAVVKYLKILCRYCSYKQPSHV